MPVPEPVSDELLGYVRYSGPLLEGGLFDTRKAAQALLGFDEAARFFAGELDPRLREVDYDFPVRVTPGSWEIQIPQTIGQWLLTGGCVAVTTYLASAAKKMAEHDFKEVGLREVFRNSLKAMQWTIRLGRHLGTTAKKQFSSLKWRKNNSEVGIEGPDGKLLFVPRMYFELYTTSSPLVLAQLAELVEEQRVLSIGVSEEDGVSDESIVAADRAIFVAEEEQELGTILPELRHGQEVTLKGDVTRGNKTTNSIGFRYKGHILDCHPLDGSIVRFKPALFGRGKMSGVVSRPIGSDGEPARKPSIHFRSLEPFEEPPSEGPLLEDA